MLLTKDVRQIGVLLQDVSNYNNNNNNINLGEQRDEVTRD